MRIQVNVLSLDLVPPNYQGPTLLALLVGQGQQSGPLSVGSSSRIHTWEAGRQTELTR